MPSRIPGALLRDPRVWRGATSHAPQPDRIASGHAELDRALHSGGWPAAGSTELLCAHSGGGELSLLMPALAPLSQQRRLAWLNPPYLPYAPALLAQGLAPSACLVVQVKGLREQLWAAEQLLRSGAFASVLTWFDRPNLADRDLRRLQLAAREGPCWHLHFRPLAAAQQCSPAPLRLCLEADGDALALHILKQPGGRSGQRLRLPRDPRLLFQQQPVDQWPQWQRRAGPGLRLAASQAPRQAQRVAPAAAEPPAELH